MFCTNCGLKLMDYEVECPSCHQVVTGYEGAEFRYCINCGLKILKTAEECPACHQVLIQKPTPQPAPVPQPTPVPQPAPAPQPTPAPQPAPVPQPAPAPQPVPQPAPTPTPQPAPAPQPAPSPQTGKDNGFESFVDTASDVADKAMGKAKDIAGGVRGKINEQIEKQMKDKKEAEERYQRELEEHRRRQEERQKQPGIFRTNKTELWTWLKKTSMRKHYYTEVPNNLSPNEFAGMVQAKIEHNLVPARITKSEIEWDRSKLKQDVFKIETLTSAANPLSCVLQFNHVGNFTFVEEKTFITPPDLPPVPDKRKAMPAIYAKLMMLIPLGLLLFIVGIFKAVVTNKFSYYGSGVDGGAMMIILFSIVMAGIGIMGYIKMDAIRTHNEMVDLQEAEWEQAWIDWQNGIFLHSFQEDINGQVSRIYEAVFDCIDQTCEKIFKDKPTEVEKMDTQMNDLEQMIARRKKEYR